MPGKNETSGSLVCSFCGKSQKEVKKLIAGPTVYICDECISLCNDIIREEFDAEEAEARPATKIPRPSEIKDILDEYNGIVAKYNHPKSIFSSLIKLNNNRQNLLKISQNARKYASKREQRQSYLDNRIFDKIDFFIQS